MARWLGLSAVVALSVAIWLSVRSPGSSTPAADAGAPRSVEPSPADAAEPRLADARSALDAASSIAGEFARLPPAPAVEARARPVLDELFVGTGSYQIECRGAYCKLDILDPGANPQWRHDLQAAGRATFDRVVIEHGTVFLVVAPR